MPKQRAHQIYGFNALGRRRHWAHSARAFGNPEPTDDVAKEAARRTALPDITVTEPRRSLSIP
jgi:hypothetical protein